MTSYTPQVDKTHYRGHSYSSQERWNSYWHQLSLVQKSGARSILEVGVGEGVVARELRARGLEVTTLDIAPDLHPDVVGSVTAIPFPDKFFDAVLAAEILEHIRFEDVAIAFKELARVTRTSAVISIPHPGYVFLLIGKIPLLRRFSFLQKIPFFWQTHQFNGEHYWELGKRGYSEKRFLALAREVGFSLVEAGAYPDDPAHHYFLFSLIPIAV